MIYLKHTYFATGLGANHRPESYGYVGPFTTAVEATQHREEYGPIGSEIVTDPDLSNDVMTPEDHEAYTRSRF